ncbi:MAG: dTDP-4-dehydrorhamnose 3,5-epimerase family protein [Gammaproteobacteria bacterium]
MRFEATPLPGTWIVLPERREDERGWFARSWCAREFAARGLPEAMVQGSISENPRRGTLRGLHFQWPPSAEGKLVRCERGAIHDVVVDLRPHSGAFLSHFAIRLDALEGNALYIPPGLAHGFETLEDDTRVAYLMTDYYDPALASGVRFDDPAFGIRWPLPVEVISERDRSLPEFDAGRHAARFPGDVS